VHCPQTGRFTVAEYRTILCELYHAPEAKTLLCTCKILRGAKPTDLPVLLVGLNRPQHRKSPPAFPFLNHRSAAPLRWTPARRRSPRMRSRTLFSGGYNGRFPVGSTSDLERTAPPCPSAFLWKINYCPSVQSPKIRFLINYQYREEARRMRCVTSYHLTALQPP
jgi:hypothetical protein